MDQWDRVHRSFERVRTATQQYTTGGSTDDRRDELLWFFQTCYHLKDWLKNDPATAPLVRADIEAFINRSTELCIVADLANGSKHFDLSGGKHPPRTGDPSTAVTRNDANVLIGAGAQMTFYVSSNGVEYEAFALAQVAIQAWDGYLRGKGLIP